MKSPKETPDQKFEVVKSLKKRHPDWEFGMCPICNEWAMVFPKYNGAHPMCWENHPTKRKKLVNTNQGTFI